MKKITFIFLLCSAFAMNAQIKGNVTDKNGEPLSFVSVYLNKTVTGTTTNDNGDYILNLKKPGKYTLVFQFIGFTTLKKEVNVASFPLKLNVVLEEENVQLQEIVISTKDNPANRIIRNVIKDKDKNTDKYANYTAKFYSRGLTRIKDAPEKFFGQSTGDFGGGLDTTRSGIIYLSETFSNISFQKKPKKFKEKIVASKVSGEDNGVSFNRAEDSNIDLYENSIAVFNGLISPISSNAFSYYNYKLVGTFYDKNEKLINKIQLLPKRKNDRVFEGFIYIVENDWALYGTDVTATGAQVNIPVVNSLKLKQGYNYSEEIKGWILISQTIDFDISIFGFKPSGKFSYTYSDYNFNPTFTESTFTNEVLSFEKNATKKDTLFWNKLRPVPLTKEEVTDYKIKDSIKVLRKSKKYLDSLDAKGNKFGLLDPIMGYTFRNSYEDWSFSYNGPLLKTGFNTVQGFNTGAGFSYFKSLNETGKWWSAGVNATYGFSDKRIRPTVYFSKKWNNISRPRLYATVGITTPQFNERKPILKLNNTFSSLLNNYNYLKIYEKQAAEISYSQEFKNGIYVSGSLAYAKRKPLFNTTDFSWVSHDKNGGYTSNNPLDATDFRVGAFAEHNIATLNLGTRFVFGQKYLSYPDSKQNIGNDKYPSIDLRYRKTFAATNSDLNSDVFITNIKQDINAGNYGNFRYHIRGGVFLKKKNIAFMDFLQPNGNQLRYPLKTGGISNFGLLDYYKFYSNDKYVEAHIEHNFRGAILGKIPLLNKLNFHLVAGSKALVMADTKPYTEYSVGLDNLGFGKWRVLRLDYVMSNYNGVSENGFLFRFSIFN
ncbi:DUF5686 and carboxypeptidase regulatory-like domain-containing protein [Polaribacter sp. IC073]|uniref:DUF5686 and carboxypeptidase regulatory-like domain-containing protein n=1 Tax=Polaribacter sp. IC073 TaxID=2508540 RepID=UPI0011BF18F4|nr:DUF5686 and carboxypeptidase regulatory-like domain-containing protein [Polaribacter sp. IC073]TXD49846.1 carboxypeptidase-like regulatory domain-containing protein [Polaribacter sp. IC073]